MKLRVLSAALVLVFALPLAAIAQDASVPRESRLQMEVKRKRAVVHPTPSPEAVAQDVETALAAERTDAIIREVMRRESRRPDLDYDVTSAIQARNLRHLPPR